MLCMANWTFFFFFWQVYFLIHHLISFVYLEFKINALLYIVHD